MEAGKSEGRLLSLQILRLVAAFGVVWCHSAEVSRSLSGSVIGEFHRIGSMGVDVFFVLSGFIIFSAGPLASPRPTAAAFFARRWIRVAPIYFLWSIPLIVLAIVGGYFDFARLASNLAFWPVWRGAFNYPFLVSGWTLCFEMVFYSSVSVLLIGGQVRRNALVIAAVFAAALLVRLLTDAPGARFLANGLMLEFMMGVGLALTRDRLRRFPPIFGLALLSLALAAILATGLKGVGGALDGVAATDTGGDLARAMAFGPLAALSVAGALICEPWARRGALTYLGDASYSIYLTHLLVLDGLALSGLRLEHVDQGVATITVVALCLAGGALAYQFVERPLLRALRSRLVTPRSEAIATRSDHVPQGVNPLGGE